MTACPAPPLDPVDELGGLGADHDKERIPPPPVIPWAPGDMPHGETLDLNEYPRDLERLKLCRSFRADLRHKLTIIIRAHGGYGRWGMARSAQALRVSRQAVWAWLRWESAPGRLHCERIDRLYSEALETLVAEKAKKKKPARRNAV